MLNTKPSWTIVDVIVVLGFIFVITNLLSWVVGEVVNTLIPLQKFLVSTLLQTGTIIIALIYFLIFRRATLSDIGFKKGKGTIKTGIFGGLILFIIVIVVGIIIELILPVPSKPQPFAQIVMETKNFRQFATVLFIGSILAPLGEELYFRGLVYPAFKYRLGITKGMLLTGAFFALLHFDIFRFIPLAIGGAGLAYLYERTGSIFTPMIAHGTWNGIMMFLLYLTDANALGYLTEIF